MEGHVERSSRRKPSADGMDSNIPRSRHESWARTASEESQVRKTCREQLHDLLDRPESSFAAAAVHYFFIVTILASTLGSIMETVPEFHMDPMFFAGEMIVTAVFTIEFALRLYICNSVGEFICNIFNVIDFLATFPGYVELILVMSTAGVQAEKQQEAPEDGMQQEIFTAASSMRTLRMVRMIRLSRVFRVMRVAKVARHSPIWSVVFAVFVTVSLSGLVAVVILMGFAMILSASLAYLFELELCEDFGEHCAGPAAFSSIPVSFWWSISTLTTVGYGDMVPHTIAGKVVGGATAIAGVVVIATAFALVSVNFRESFIEEQVRDEHRRRVGSKENVWRTQDENDEMSEMLEDFNINSSLLFKKLRSMAARQEHGGQLSLMLDTLTSHTNVLISDVNAFLENALPDVAARNRDFSRMSSDE